MTLLTRLIAFLLTLALATPAAAQLGTVPYTFTPGTTIRSAEINANFSAAYANALNRTGGTMTGALTAQTIAAVTGATYDIGTTSTRFKDAYLSGILYAGGGVAITSNVPADTSMKLYNNSGTLTWNGITVATGSSVSGTTGMLAKFTGANSIGDSSITQSGTNIAVGGTLGWGGGAAISSSGNVALLNAANAFTAKQSITGTAFGDAGSGQLRLIRQADTAQWLDVSVGGGDFSIRGRHAATYPTFSVVSTNNVTDATVFSASPTAAVAAGSLAWGNGAAISSSDYVPRLNAANTFTGTNSINDATLQMQHSAVAKLIIGVSTGVSNLINGSAENEIAIRTQSVPLLFSTDSGNTIGMRLSAVSLLTVYGFGTHSFSAGGTAGNNLVVRNTTDGAGNFGEIRAQANDTVYASLTMFADSFSTAGPNVAAGARLATEGAGGLSIAAIHASGAIRHYTGGTTLRGTEFASGGFSWGDTTDPGATNFRVAGTIASGAVTSAGHITVAPVGGVVKRLELLNAAGTRVSTIFDQGAANTSDLAFTVMDNAGFEVYAASLNNATGFNLLNAAQTRTIAFKDIGAANTSKMSLTVMDNAGNPVTVATSTSATFAMPIYGAGTATFDASGNITSATTLSPSTTASSLTSVGTLSTLTIGATTLKAHASGGVSIGDATDPGATNLRVAGTIASIGQITGNLTGNVTGNASGTAATVTGAAQTAITSVGTLSALTVSGATALGSTTTTGGWGVNSAGDWTFGASAHIVDSTGTPTCGSGCTSVTGTDYAFRIVPSSTSSPAPTVNFAHTWSSAPVCVATPVGTTIGNTSTLYITGLNTVGIALAASLTPNAGVATMEVLCRGF